MGGARGAAAFQCGRLAWEDGAGVSEGTAASSAGKGWGMAGSRPSMLPCTLHITQCFIDSGVCAGAFCPGLAGALAEQMSEG